MVHLEVDFENGGGSLAAVPGGEDLLLVQYGDPRLHRVFKCLHTKNSVCRIALTVLLLLPPRKRCRRYTA
jgi:hypothetical protein